ncbi:MAG: DUF3667 domain-containing protein [Myxococcota bacterium]
MPDTVKSPRAPERCLDCNTVIEQEYCPACGQHRGDYRRSLWQLVGALISDVFEVDGRLWRTSRAMLRPGRLTREFNAGRRRRYMSPVRLYLFISLVMFATASIGLRVYTVLEPAASGPTTPAISVSFTDDSALDQWQPDHPLGQAIKKRMTELERMPKNEAAIELVRGTLEHAPLVMFCMLPVYALMLKLLFLGTRWLYVDHLVFALHVHTVWFLCVTFIIALGPFVPIPVLVVLAVLPGIYTVFALQHAYSDHWVFTALRAAFLAMGYPAILSFGITLAMALGIILD